MKPLRLLSVVLTCGLLVACDQPTPQKPVPTPTVPKTEQKAEQPTSAGRESSRPAPVAKEAPAPAAKPAPSKPAPDQVAASKPKPQAAKAETKVAKVKLPESKLDLRLPPELAKKVEVDDALDTVPQEPLLPPMFVEKEPAPAPFQLNGRLLTNDQPSSDNAVQGAELQFQFRN